MPKTGFAGNNFQLLRGSLTNCGTVVMDGKLLDGIDGVIPLSLFSQFPVRLDLRGKSLELEPYPAATQPADAGDLPVRADRGLFFLSAVVNGSQPGYILQDAGATYNAVSPRAARATNTLWNSPGSIPLQGGSGASEGLLLPTGVRFRCGPRVLPADPAVVVDLSGFSRHHALEVSGILGYPALRNSSLTVNYRDSRVRIEGK